MSKEEKNANKATYTKESGLNCPGSSAVDQQVWTIYRRYKDVIDAGDKNIVNAFNSILSTRNRYERTPHNKKHVLEILKQDMNNFKEDASSHSKTKGPSILKSLSAFFNKQERETPEQKPDEISPISKGKSTKGANR